MVTNLKETKEAKCNSMMPPDLALRLTLISSNYPCLEHNFMVPKVSELLKFYYIENKLCLFRFLCLSIGILLPFYAIKQFKDKNTKFDHADFLFLSIYFATLQIRSSVSRCTIGDSLRRPLGNLSATARYRIGDRFATSSEFLATGQHPVVDSSDLRLVFTRTSTPSVPTTLLFRKSGCRKV